MKNPRSFAPIIAAVLLLLPVLYVGTYLALVSPDGYGFTADGSYLGNSRKCHLVPYSTQYYRFGGSYADAFFWPLEQIDRRLRSDAWGFNPRSVTPSSGDLLTP